MARQRQAVTIRHVAAEAGVSLQTVSRVINNHPSVRAEVRGRVQSAIDRLGYVPSIAAQRMSGSRSYLILAINDRDRTIADWRSRQGTDWVDQMLLGGMLKCAEHGYRMIFELVDTRSDHVERELLGALAAVRPDGVLLTPPHSDNPQMVRLLARQGIAFARIGSTDSAPGIAITMDDEGAAAEATQHLLALGHRRIGFVAGPADYALSGRRVTGWREAMTEAGLTTDGLLARGDFSYASGARAAHGLLGLPPGHRPTAIIASNDQMALAALEVARARGIDVPHALSLISFDNTPPVHFAQPPLTAIDQPIAAITARAVERIIALQQGQAPTPIPEVMGAALVVRGSTGPASAAETSLVAQGG